MSAKCKYSSKFWPLVSQMQAVLERDAFKAFLLENFTDGEQVFSDLSGGVNFNTSTNPIFEPKQIDTRTDIITITEDSTIRSHYVGNVTEYNRMLRRFKTDIISKSVFDRTTYNAKTRKSGSFIDANAISDNGQTFLNRNLGEHKVQLINTLREYVGLDPVRYRKDLTYVTFTSWINEALSDFATAVNGTNAASDSRYQNALDAYVVLKNYNKLLKEYTPFIEVKAEYANSPYHSINMYTYKGPNVQHFTGWGSNKDVDISKQTSDLATILLDYFPELNEQYEPVDGTSITVTGFNSAMTSVKAAVMYNNSPYLNSVREEVYKGAKADMTSIIDAYLNFLSKADDYTDHVSYLHSKLRAIKKFIYESDLHPDLRNIFTAMFSKTVPVSYRAYYQDVEQGIMSKSLKEQFTNVQSFRFNDVVRASVYNFKNNPEAFQELLDKYNIKIGNGLITFSQITLGDVEKKFSIKYDWKASRGEAAKYVFSTLGTIDNDSSLQNIVYDVLSYIVPDDFESVGAQVMGNKWRGAMHSFAPLIGITLLAANGDSAFDTDSYGLVKMSPYTYDIREAARIASVIFGSDTLNVIKNLEGNNLPLYQLNSLAYNYLQLTNDLKKVPDSIYSGNFLLNSELVKPPVVRSEIGFNKKIKKPADLTVSEVLRASIVYDFYQNISRDARSVDNGVIYLQNTTFADKNTHYLIPYDTKKTVRYREKDYNLQNILNNAVRNGDTSQLEELFFFSRRSKMTNLVTNLLRDYSTAFSTEFTSLDAINKYIVENELSVDKIQSRFNEVGIALYENIHYYKPRTGIKFPQMNETIQNWNKIFSDKEATNKRLDNEKRKFAKNLLENGFQLNISDDAVIKDMADKVGTQWVNRDSLILAKAFDSSNKPVAIKRDGSTFMDPNNRIVLNPILQTYFMTDILLSNEYNSLMIGEVYAHANKNSEGSTPEQYAEFSEANRLIAQYKRAVILGATHHPFLQGLDNGVPENIKIAVISDVQAEVLNMIGDLKGDLEAMDGAGFSSPHQSIFENNSLLDARVGEDKKTIMHSLDASYGNPLLLKWAVFNFNNMRRQLSQGSDISIENLFRLMHSVPLDKEFDVKKYFADYGQDVFFKDYRDGKFYKIANVAQFVDDDGVFKVTRETYEVDENSGNRVDPRIYVDTFNATTLYELDQIFGGAFSVQFDSDYGRMVNAQHNLDIVNRIIVGENFKDKYIAYLVNKSAIKVGAGNINPSSMFNSDNKSSLMTINMSTKYGGVQMDADHDLDYAKVTEMTQMLSALEQNGYTHDLANAIYKDIGAVVTESMQKFNSSIQEGDRTKVYTLLGRALVESFNTGDKDTLGLAQAFVSLASKNLQQNSLEYKLPFSASTINGAFIATVTSMLVKKGIRRKYDGVAAVLTPSYGMIQYYNLDGTNYTFNEMADLILSHVENDYDEFGYITRSAWDKALNDEYLNDGQTANPFIRLVQNRNEISQEDYILVRDRVTGETVPEFSGKVDTFTKYDLVKNVLSDEQYTFWNWTIKPKNLRGSDTTFDIMVPGLNGVPMRKTFSIYDVDSVRASLYMNKSERSEYENALIERVYGEPITNVSKATILKNLRAKTQLVLEALESGREIPVSLAFGIEDGMVTPVTGSVNVRPAEIIMGKLNAAKFGLRQGDTISQIENYVSPTDSEGRPLYANFFHERLQSNYQMPTIDKKLFDVVLFTGTGTKVLVKIATKSEINRELQDIKLEKSDNFSIVDNDVYYNNKFFTTTNQKQFYTYTTETGEQYDLIVINDVSELDDIRNSKMFDTYRYNYTEANWTKLVDIVYSREVENGRPIFLPFKDTRGITQYKPLDVTSLFAYEILADAEAISFDGRLRNSSQHKLESFNKQLNYIGARIPSQSMQSFMPMKVVAFTDSEVADVYVTKYNTWLEGSDYDIDKLYIMGYSIDDNGHFQTQSNLQNDFPIDMVQQLPKPNGLRYQEGEDGTFISLEKLQQVVGTFESIDGVASSRLSLDPFVEIMNSESTVVKFEEPVPVMMGNRLNRPMTEQANREFQKKKSEFLKLLNRHTTTRLNTFAQENALKNKVVSGIFDVILNPKNQINLHIPIDMKEQQDAAKKSALGDAEKIMSSDNPATKYIMQVQNMVGKQVIGAVAVSLKVFFGVSNYYNSEFENLITLVDEYRNNEIVDALNRLIFKNPETQDLGIIANVQLNPLITHLQDLNINDIAVAPQIEINEVLRKYVNNGNLRLLDLLIDLQTISSNVDSALSISGLLSAATDNAKELILAKINAGSKFVDIYTYLMSIGSSFDSIADIMTSPIFNEVSRLVDTNIFDITTYGFNLKGAIDFYLNKGTLPFLNKDIFEEVAMSLMNENGFEIIDYNSDPKVIQSLRKSIFEKMQSLRGSRNTTDIEIDEDQLIEQAIADEGLQQDVDSSAYEMLEGDYGAEDNSLRFEKRDFVKNPVKAFEYAKVLRFLEYVQDRNEVLNSLENLDKQLGYLELLSTSVIPATEEMRILGRIFGINQGIRTNNYEKYSYIKSIESFVNRRINDYKRENAKNLEAQNLEDLNVMRFLNDVEYKKKQIAQYETIKSTYNILDMITKVPHFSAMFNILAIDDYLLKDYAVRGTLERNIADEVVSNSFTSLNQPEFREMSRYINDLLIVNWLFESGLEIEVPTGQKYYTGWGDDTAINTVEGTFIPLNSLPNLATFKSIMEEYIIPAMKKDPDFADNAFVKSLSKSVVTDPRTKGVKIYSRLPLNMMQIDASQKTQIIYERILEGFNSIANKEFNGWRVADLFYLYNLVTHKDSFGINALTRLFEDLASSGDESLMVNQYNKWLSDIDFDEGKEGIQYNLKDLKFRLAGYPGSYNKFGSRLTPTQVEIAVQNTVEAYDVQRFNPSDFTFNMQFLENQAPSVVKEDVKALTEKDDSYYKGAPTTREVVLSLTDRLFEAYNGSVEIVTNQEVANSSSPLVRNARAYIDNGTVYINIDKANTATPLHEFSHLVMAGLKALHPDEYYHLLSAITEHEQFEYLANLPIHASLHGSDLKEEVFIKLMETYFQNKTYGQDFATEFSTADDVVKKVIDFVFDIDTSNTDIHDLMATNTTDVLKIFGSKLFDYDFASIIDINAIQLSQRLATLKDQAIRSELIKEDCE